MGPAALLLPGVNCHCRDRIGGGYMPIHDFDFIFIDYPAVGKTVLVYAVQGFVVMPDYGDKLFGGPAGTKSSKKDPSVLPGNFQVSFKGGLFGLPMGGFSRLVAPDYYPSFTPDFPGANQVGNLRDYESSLRPPHLVSPPGQMRPRGPGPGGGLKRLRVRPGPGDSP